MRKNVHDDHQIAYLYRASNSISKRKQNMQTNNSAKVGFNFMMSHIQPWNFPINDIIIQFKIIIIIIEMQTMKKTTKKRNCYLFRLHSKNVLFTLRFGRSFFFNFFLLHAISMGMVFLWMDSRFVCASMLN